MRAPRVRAALMLPAHARTSPRACARHKTTSACRQHWRVQPDSVGSATYTT
jgi:hypothetical protein